MSRDWTNSFVKNQQLQNITQDKKKFYGKNHIAHLQPIFEKRQEMFLLRFKLFVINHIFLHI